MAMLIALFMTFLWWFVLAFIISSLFLVRSMIFMTLELTFPILSFQVLFHLTPSLSIP